MKAVELLPIKMYIHSTFCIYFPESCGPKEVHPVPQVKNPENENMTTLQFRVAEL